MAFLLCLDYYVVANELHFGLDVVYHLKYFVFLCYVLYV